MSANDNRNKLYEKGSIDQMKYYMNKFNIQKGEKQLSTNTFSTFLLVSIILHTIFKSLYFFLIFQQQFSIVQHAKPFLLLHF